MVMVNNKNIKNNNLTINDYKYLINQLISNNSIFGYSEKEEKKLNQEGYDLIYLNDLKLKSNIKKSIRKNLKNVHDKQKTIIDTLENIKNNDKVTLNKIKRCFNKYNKLYFGLSYKRLLNYKNKYNIKGLKFNGFKLDIEQEMEIKIGAGSEDYIYNSIVEKRDNERDIIVDRIYCTYNDIMNAIYRFYEDYAHEKYTYRAYFLIKSNIYPNHVDVEKYTDMIEYKKSNNKQNTYTQGNSYGPKFSDNDFDAEVELEYKIELRHEKKSRPDGAFFKYYNLSDINLRRYQIYTREEYEKNKISSVNCLFYSLVISGLKKEKINKLQTILTGRDVPRIKLDEISKTLDIKINLFYKDKGSEHIRKNTYGTNNDEVFNINLFENHYFINENVQITEFAIKNYMKVKDYKDFYNIKYFEIKKNGKEYPRKIKNHYISSFRLVELMLESGLFETLNIRDLIKLNDNKEIKNKIYNNEDLIINLNDSRLKELKRKREYINDENVYIVYFDFETYTVNGKHTPYLVHYEDSDGNHKKFIGDNCSRLFIDDLVNSYYNKMCCLCGKRFKIRLMAHNAKYDQSFINQYIKLDKHSGIIMKDGIFYKLDGYIQTEEDEFNNDKSRRLYIEIVDSYKLIPMPLREFGGCFNLEVHKEVCPYELYNVPGYVKKRYIKLYECLKYLKNKEDKQIYINNCKKWNLINSKGEVDILEYSSIYCGLDVHVLRLGFEKFKKMVAEGFNMNVDDYLTISSLSDAYFTKNECYAGCYELGGMIRSYIQNSIVGGRCMTRDNLKHKVYIVLGDFDAVSLYPSAMYYLGDVYGGYLKGTGKVLEDEQKNMDFLSTVDGYFIQIRINKIKRKYTELYIKYHTKENGEIVYTPYHFPLFSIKNSDGIRVFTDDLNGCILTVNRFDVEDLIKYYNVDFDILSGYYFNEGRNDTIKDVIQDAFNQRLKKKEEKNPIQLVYKLILNSCYGKTILKENHSKVTIIDKQRKNKYLDYNYKYIKCYKKLNNKYIFESYVDPLEHFNMCHIGSEILSVSKLRMNRVMCLADDLNINIYYQDTDSMHIEYDKLDLLTKTYKDIYGEDLQGTKLCQYHVDFELKDAAEDIKSIKSIFLSKKCYIDILESKNKNNEIINGYHIRMKGVPSACIVKMSEELNINPFDIYDKLYKGESIQFDLNKVGCHFKYNSLDSIETQTDFKRTIKF